jgi:DNA replication protein DnaC
MNKLFPRYADKSLADFQILDPSHEAALQTVKDYLSRLYECCRMGIGLTFLGPVGVGKTYLAQMVLKEAQAQGHSIESVELSTYIDLHQERMMLSRSDPEGDEIQVVNQHIRKIRGKTDFVLFDDMGREHAGDSGWSNHILYDTLRFRSNRNLPFLITTSLPISRLDDRYTEGFSSLLHEVTELIVIEGKDFRCGAGK